MNAVPPNLQEKSSHKIVFFITTIKDLPALLKSLGPISAESLRDWTIPRVSELQSLVSGRWQGRYSTGYSKATHWWDGVHVSGHPVLTIPSCCQFSVIEDAALS